MKSLNEYLIVNEKLSKEAFDKWFEETTEYEDLYSFYSDKVDPNWNKSNIDKYVKELIENTGPNILRQAEEAGYNPEMICRQAIEDSL